MARTATPSPATPSAHTAGPWILEENCDRDVPYLELKGDNGSKRLAHLYDMSEASEDDYETAEDCEKDLAEYEANARLIEKAWMIPELVAALDQASKDLCFLQSCLRTAGSSIERQKTIDACEAAIAKVEGRG